MARLVPALFTHRSSSADCSPDVDSRATYGSSERHLYFESFSPLDTERGSVHHEGFGKESNVSSAPEVQHIDATYQPTRGLGWQAPKA
jgi:hypothetical protein